MEEGVRLLGLGEVADEVDGIALEHLDVGNVEPAVVDAKIAAGADAAPGAPAQRIEQPGEPRRRLDLLDLQRRAQDSRQIADVLGDEEIVLHEALDTAQAAALHIAQPFRHRCLHVEGQPLLRPPRQEVQVAPDRPQQVHAAAEGGVLLGREHPRLHGGRIDAVAVEVLGEPMQRVQVAQAALAVLDVGLDAVARFAGAAVALVALGKLGLDELAGRPAHDLAPEPPRQLLEQRLITQDQARIE